MEKRGFDRLKFVYIVYFYFPAFPGPICIDSSNRIVFGVAAWSEFCSYLFIGRWMLSYELAQSCAILQEIDLLLFHIFHLSLSGLCNLYNKLHSRGNFVINPDCG